MPSSLSRKKANRSSMLRNLATSLILYERITTTTAKAKEVKAIVEHLIQSSRKNDLNVHRHLLSYLFDKNAVKKVIEDILPRYKDIKSGLIRSYKQNPRKGDGAELTILELQKGKILLESENGKEKPGKNTSAKETIEKAGKTNNSRKESAKKTKSTDTKK